MSTPKLTKADNGYFYAIWSDNGRSKRKSMGTQDRAVAENRFGQWLLIRNEAPSAPGEIYKVADVWEVYWTRYGSTTTGAATLAFNWKALEPFFGEMAVGQVDQGAVDAYVARRTTGRLGRKVKPQTCRKELSALFAALRFCARAPHKLYDAATVQPVDLPEAADPRDRWLRTEELQKLLNAAARLRRGDRLSRVERFLWLALETAARQQAILDLTWDRVDFEAGVIHYDVPGRKKTKKRRAAVAISKALRPVLERAYTERRNNLVLDNGARCWTAVQLVAIEAGLGGVKPAPRQKPAATGISPHVLRHTAATHMARRGVPLYAIAKILGNTSQMVEKVYAKWAPDDPAGTVDKISNSLLEAAE
jgi:integrase